MPEIQVCDACQHCSVRGDLKACLNTICSQHDSWIFKTMFMMVPKAEALMGEEGKPENLMGHVDDFVGLNFGKHQYARWVLFHMRTSAALKQDFDPFMREHKLFCTFEGVRYRCVTASRMGDVGLTADFNKQTYDLGKRVSVMECTDWSDKP